jgi:Mrp family chromosome partitioning ATPase
MIYTLPEITDEYRALRVTLESMVAFPTVLAVGSASTEDGTGVVACNLARAFAEAGHRTVIVDPYGGETVLARLGLETTHVKDVERLSAGAVNGAIANLSTIVVGDAARLGKVSTGRIRAAVAHLKRSFDIVLVDLQQLGNSSIALSLACVSDGVLVAFRLGRKPLPSDKEIVLRLESVKAHVLGVVATGDSEPVTPSIQTSIEDDVRPTDRAATTPQAVAVG